MNTPIYNRDNTTPADGWFQIEVSGEHAVGDGRRQLIDEAALKAIVNRFKEEAGKEGFAGILVDADHLSHDLSKDTAALAWLKDLDIRNGQLHGLLDLTDLGEAAVKGKRYKWFSTEYSAADLEPLGDGRVRPTRLSGLAFTNRPNNRGAKPISNRADTPSGEKQETKDTTMKSIAEKLGLSAEATEADILNRIGSLQGEVETMKKNDAETKADAIMNRLGERVPEAVRPQWRDQLIANREITEKLMEASFPVKKAEDRIFNRDAANPQVAEMKSGDEKGDAQAALVNQIRNRDRCTHTQAWESARRERPELFN
jgi:hypothetical protein